LIVLHYPKNRILSKNAKRNLTSTKNNFRFCGFSPYYMYCSSSVGVVARFSSVHQTKTAPIWMPSLTAKQKSTPLGVLCLYQSQRKKSFPLRWRDSPLHRKNSPPDCFSFNFVCSLRSHRIGCRFSSLFLYSPNKKAPHWGCFFVWRRRFVALSFPHTFPKRSICHKELFNYRISVRRLSTLRIIIPQSILTHL